MENWYALKRYLAVTGDGMTNRRRVGCINVEALTRYGPVHVDNHERKAQTEAVDADYVANIFNTSITELGGAARVVNIVSDNESKMRNVWELVKQAHPGVLSLPCSAHIGNLLMKDIGNIPRVKRLLVAVRGICDHVLNHSFPLALFREKVQAHKELNGKDLVLDGKTRYGSKFTMGDRLNDLKVPIRELAVDQRYEQCDAKDDAFVRHVLNADFWGHLERTLSIMEPVYMFIRYADGAKADAGIIFQEFRTMGERIRQAESNDAAAAYECFKKRLAGTNRKIGFHQPAHSAAMLVHPHNWDIDFAQVYPDAYNQIRSDLVEVFSDISKSPEDTAIALLQFDNEFRNKTLGTFQKPVIQLTASQCVDAAAWWESYGNEIPQLQYIAVRLLSLGLANSAAERNWSIHNFLHSKGRSRLSFQKQRSLVNVYVNTKLREKLENQNAVKYFTEDEFEFPSSDEEEN